MSDYYKIDIAKLSIAEAWRWGGIKYVIVIVALKLLRVKRYGARLVPSSSGMVRIGLNEISAGQLALIEPIVSELSHSGFEVAYLYRAVDAATDGGFAVVTVNQTGDTMGLVAYARSGSVEQASVSLISVLSSGEYLVTGNTRVSFSPPREVLAVRLLDAPVGKVVTRHLQRVDQNHVRPIRVADTEPLILEMQRIAREENIRRGLYVPA